MTNQPLKKITKYETLFASRTGLTLMFPKIMTLDNDINKDCFFKTIDGQLNNILLLTVSSNFIIKGLKDTYIKTSICKGFIMIYETYDDEVVRNTICKYKK